MLTFKETVISYLDVYVKCLVRIHFKYEFCYTCEMYIALLIREENSAPTRDK